MRKCDICDTVIPVGSDRCPNCGYRYKTERRMSQATRNAKKISYMSQFQPHPSPLDEVKKKVDNFDFSKLLESIPKTRKPAVATNVNKKVKRIILIIIAMTLITTAVPIIIGVFIGVSSGITDIFEDVDIDFDNEYVYEWYDNYTDLEAHYPEYAKEVYPYRQHILEIIHEDEYLYEDYNVTEDGLDYVYISGGVSRDLVDEVIYTDVFVTHSGWEDSWTITYSSNEYFAENEEVIPNLAYLDDIAMLSGVSKDTLVQEVQTYTDHLVENLYSELYIGDKLFTINYSDGFLNYQLIVPIVLE